MLGFSFLNREASDEKQGGPLNFDKRQNPKSYRKAGYVSPEGTGA